MPLLINTKLPMLCFNDYEKRHYAELECTCDISVFMFINITWLPLACWRWVCKLELLCINLIIKRYTCHSGFFKFSIEIALFDDCTVLFVLLLAGNVNRRHHTHNHRSHYYTYSYGTGRDQQSEVSHQQLSAVILIMSHWLCCMI